MEFKPFITRAWDDHADAPQAVAERLPAILPWVVDEDQLSQVMNLAHHVYGAHLGDWRGGISVIEQMKELPAFDPHGPSGQACARMLASLSVAEGSSAVPVTWSDSDRIRVGALAASSLAEHDTARALPLLQDALALASRAALPATDPVHRALAAAGNNLACALEEKPHRNPADRELMILAAQTARRHWAIAGTWLETERAEYRLAMTWLQAGDFAQARGHAQACLAIVEENQGPALERFFGWEALGLVERAAGDAEGYARAVARAREHFEQLAESDKAWCARSLSRLAG